MVSIVIRFIVRLYLRFTDARVTDKDDLYGDELGVYIDDWDAIP